MNSLRRPAHSSTPVRPAPPARWPSWISAALLALPWPALAELDRHPTAVGTNIDIGEIVQGSVYDGSTNYIADDQIITRTGVYLTESGTYNGKLTIRLTIGGLFWFSLPEAVSFQSRLIRFGPGVGQAQGTYAFGDPGQPGPELQVGLFPVKYSDATNLGEYLYRSGTYPGYLRTGGWSYLNAASYLAQGARFTLPMWEGKLSHTLTLYMERDIEPTHDFSPGYQFTFKPASAFQLGGGLVWSHGLPLKSDRILTPKGREYSYSKITNRPLSTEDAQKPGYAYYGPGNPANSPLVVPDGDPRIGTPDADNKTYVDTAGNGTPINQLGHYTFKGFKAMARASLDIGALLGIDAVPAGSFKIYGEAALLGIKDYPYYYERKSERMPKMVGLNVPTLGLLDLLSLEVEHHKSRFPNTIGSAFQGQLPFPIHYQENPLRYDFDSSSFQQDDWKWSVYARRKLLPGVTVYAQAARDHLRHFNFGAEPGRSPSTDKPGDWYYVARLELGI